MANPLAFTPWPVTIITTLVYLALLVPVLLIHFNVPVAPQTSPDGLNLTEAWADLQTLTGGFHPYNSHRNDEVRDWLLKRVDAIHKSVKIPKGEQKPDVFVFDDRESNLTSVDGRLGVYFEGNNILVYIRGSEDTKELWWETGTIPANKGGVLVNAHFDSVSTGYGATDDGVGVVTCLQLLRYFTTPGNAPRRGLVILLNNGEEDYLNGARAYSQHPMSIFAHTFVNLEGAGAGGRATLFRSSDGEVTRAYAQAKHPFGTVISANGFESGLVRSQTDYVVFDGMMGLRGLDIAFFEPRARYHTNQDDTKHTSIDSLWHMLSTAVASTEALVSDTSDEFDGRHREDGKVSSGTGTKALWFDLFGVLFAVCRLHTFFALSVTILIVGPVTLLFTSIALSKADKMYLFRSWASVDYDEKVPIRGLRGFFRFPCLFIIPTGTIVGLAFLLTKVNPFISHSSSYAVWSMMISAWIFLAWFVSRVADFARPSAFHRVYTWTWLFIISWSLLVIALVYENERGLAGGYFMLWYFTGVFLATWISYLELFALPRKSEYLSSISLILDSRRPSSYGSRLALNEEDDNDADDVDEPTESTSLLRTQQRTTFANYVHVAGDHVRDGCEEEEEEDPRVYPYEQSWSGPMPTWTWSLQLILTVPIILTLVAPISLLLTSALNQTGQDGSPQLFVYICIATLTVVLFMPILPFIHRLTYHIPLFLFFVLIGTLLYNLIAFPFSENNRVKMFFSQQVDLDRGNSTAYLTGVSPFVEGIVRGLPSAAGKVECHDYLTRVQCGWAGAEPQVVPNSTVVSSNPSKDWVSYSISQPKGHSVQFEVSGQNTRSCRITILDLNPIMNFNVLGSSPADRRFYNSKSAALQEIRLWSRDWDNKWVVNVDLPEHGITSIKGRISCIWSDHNTPGVIPALDEAIQYVPAWVAVTKLADGLVEGYRGFELKRSGSVWSQV